MYNNCKILEIIMATWLEKLNKASSKIGDAIDKATTNTVKTYQEKGLDGIAAKTGEIFAQATDKTQDYLRDLKNSNSNVLKEVDESVEEGGITKILAKGVAATVHTTQVLVDDVTNVTKKTYKDLTTDNPKDIVGDTSSLNIKIETPQAESVDPRFAFLDAISLEKTLTFIGAREEALKNKWKDNQTGLVFMILNDRWYSPTVNKGGQGSVSLMSYHLATLKDLDYDTPIVKKAVTRESLYILESILQEPEAEVVSTKAPARKKAQKVAEVNEGVLAEKPVRKTSRKKVIAPVEEKVVATKSTKKKLQQKL